MKHLIRKINFILFLLSTALLSTEVFSKENKIEYSRNNVANYFSGIVSSNQDYTTRAFKYLNKVKLLKNRHNNFNIQFIQTLILLEKFEEAFDFSKDVSVEDEYFFEADLLLGLQSFLKEDYVKAEKYFEKLNNVSIHDLNFKNFLGNVLISWSKAAQNNEASSLEYFKKIPDRYESLKKIQYSFLQCYFDTKESIQAFNNIIQSQDSSFSRYNFFLANHLLYKNKNNEAAKTINISRKANNSNLLIKQSENFLINKESKKIKNFFDCKDPKDNMAEIFYVLANLHSTQKDYHLSNFYLKISFFLNNKFTPNKTLLAENLYYQKKYELSKKAYNSIKKIGPVYSWYASINLAIILSETKGKKYSPSDLEEEFKLISNPSFENYYEIANFFKDNEYYEKSIEYYSLTLNNIKKNHDLVPKILDRRGTSYERLGEWENAERDLKESLKIIPDQPHVLNYLAYSWVDKGINIEEALEMLKRALKMRENDAYIIDSLGWAYYAKKNYVNAEKLLRRAVEIMPLDPIVNDHYGDVLWMLNKNMQARYFWKHVLNLDATDQKLREKVNKKLIFGIL